MGSHDLNDLTGQTPPFCRPRFLVHALKHEKRREFFLPVVSSIRPKKIGPYGHNAVVQTAVMSTDISDVR